MRILVLTTNPWDDRNSIGNTMSNFFSSWTDCDFYNIYFRDSAPNNKVCGSYFRISDKMLLKNLFTPNRIGYEFSAYSKTLSVSDSEKTEQRLIGIIKRYNLRFIYGLEKLLWNLKGWQNKKLKDYLERVNPQIVFLFGIPSTQYYLTLKYIKENTNAKVALFIADNVYGNVLKGKKSPNSIKARRFREMIGMSDLIYGASEELCDTYGKEFSREIFPLYKGCEFSANVKQTVGSPIKLTYAGNLLFGRYESLVTLCNQLRDINKNDCKIFLEIYSGTPLTSAQTEGLNVENCSAFMGRRQYDEIKNILSSSDIVLHIESFDESIIDSVRYSFSTKIIDCLQSGSVLLVIGPKGISSVEYPKKIKGAIVADCLEIIPEILENIINNPEQLTQRAMDINSFALENHSITAVHRNLKDNFKRISEEK